MDNDLKLPIFDWFVGDVFSKFGNCYVGSVGALSIFNNAFCYKVCLDRSGETALLRCDCYDVLTISEPQAHITAEFEGTPEGWSDVQQWLVDRYSDYINAGRNKLSVEF